MNDVKKKVLLADDIELFLELEKTFFRRENFELLTARTGAQAYEIIRNQRPDLVFMDLYMPELDGDVCCRRVKDDPELSGTAIVIVTTMGDAAAQERCRACGCDDVLLKPINRHLFTETARRLLSVAQRAEPRVPARLEVRYGVGQAALTEFTVNISSGGIFLEMTDPLPIGTDLQLTFSLPVRSAPIRCAGRVAWANHAELPVKPGFPAGIGIQLLGLSLDDLHVIRDFMKEQCLTASW